MYPLPCLLLVWYKEVRDPYSLKSQTVEVINKFYWSAILPVHLNLSLYIHNQTQSGILF